VGQNLTDLAGFYDEAYSHSGPEGERWARWRALSARGKADHVVALHPDAPDVVCEVGCGDGALLAELAGRGYGREHVGYEVSGEAAAIAGARPELRVAAFDGERLPEADRAFDLGILSHVLEHVPDPVALLRETARVCREVVVEVPLEDNLSARRPAKVAEAQRIGHLQRFSRADVHRIAGGAGLRVADELSDALPLEVHRFHGGGRGKWAVRATTLRVAPPLARRLFTVHHAALLV
jgi:SAM-dependent methyltransferase